MVTAILVFVMGYFTLFIKKEPYAYVHVDINPSLEFALDKGNFVKEVTPINEDAKNLLKNINLENLPFGDAIEVYLDHAKTQGYLQEKNRNTNFLLISVALNKNSGVVKTDRIGMEKELEIMIRALEVELSKLYGSDTNSLIVKVSDNYKEKSEENQVSMGRYLMYEKIIEKGNTISIEEVKTGKVYQIIQSNKIFGTEMEEIGIQAEDPISKVTISPAATPGKTLESTPSLVTSTPTVQKTAVVTDVTTPNAVRTSVIPTPKVTSPLTPVILTVPSQEPVVIEEIVPSPVSATVDTAQYNFEGGLYGFGTSMGGKIYLDTEKAFAGSKCARICIDKSDDEIITTQNIEPGIAKGTVITFHVWIPASKNIIAVEPFYQNANWEWSGNWIDYSELTPNGWNTITLKVNNKETLPVRGLGVKFAIRDSGFAGDLYVDSISWE